MFETLDVPTEETLGKLFLFTKMEVFLAVVIISKSKILVHIYF